jgi:hypothetical protein
MSKSTKGPVSQFIIENLSEIESIHQYIEGSFNSLSDAASRYPMLGPRHLAPRGLTNSIDELLSRLPSTLKSTELVHVHAGTHTSDVRQIVQAWSLIPKSVVAHSPVRRGAPEHANLAILVPRPEVSPVTLALYLLSNIPFGILISVDLLDQAYAVNLFPDSPSASIEERFKAAGKLTILATQMTWVIGNIPSCTPVEMFSSSIQTEIPIESTSDTFLDPIPQTIEYWVEVQEQDSKFEEFSNGIQDSAVRNGLHIYLSSTKPTTCNFSSFRN